VQVYCEMSLNGGGYTFLNPKDFSNLTNAEVQAMFTDKNSFLLRVRRTDNTQAYGVLAQLPQFQYVLFMHTSNLHVVVFTISNGSQSSRLGWLGIIQSYRRYLLNCGQLDILMREKLYDYFSSFRYIASFFVKSRQL